MENLEWIISLSSAVVGLIAAVAAIVVKYVKNSKIKKTAQQALAVCNAVIPYIEEAESFTHYSGQEKKAYVMTKARQYALNQKMQIDEKLISDHIEELITLSKDVNARGNSLRGGAVTIPAR